MVLETSGSTSTGPGIMHSLWKLVLDVGLIVDARLGCYIACGFCDE
jgi:hypothetical protein